jgi:hypothetical protein
MGHVTGLVLVLILALPVAAQEKTLRLEGPKDAKDEELQKAATAFQSRCEAFGYKGITSRLIEKDGKKLVELSCDLGFTDRMMPRIKLLSAKACKAVTLRFNRPLDERESEQYEPGKTAPAGAEWVTLKGYSRPLLVEKEPNSELAGKFQIKKGCFQHAAGQCAAFDRTALGSKKALDLFLAFLVVDGLYTPSVKLEIETIVDEDAEKPRTPQVHIVGARGSADEEIFVVSLANPMPFPLKIVE